MKYVPFSQQPYCCVPTSLQMVLYRRGLPLLSQEEIGFDLGLTVPTTEHAMLPGARSWDTPPTTAGFDTQIQNDEFSINRFFKRHSYPLRHRYVGPSDFEANMDAWIDNEIDQDHDLIVCFNYLALFGEGGDNGHVSVLESLDHGTVTLVEPMPREPKFRRLPLTRLLDSMRHHGEANSGGFWAIEPE